MKRSSNLWSPNGPIKRHREETRGQFNGQSFNNFHMQIPGAPYNNGIPRPPHLMGNNMGPGPSGGYQPPSSFPDSYRQFPRYQPYPQFHRPPSNNYQSPNAYDHSNHANANNLNANSSSKSTEDCEEIIILENDREENDAFPKITKSVMDYVRSNGQTSQLLDTKFRLRGQFEQHLRRLFPNCDLFIFGSSASGFGSTSSDMDMCLVTNNNIHLKDVKLLYRIRSVLCSLHPLVDVQVINAKVPILKFVHKPTDIQCDLNINNSDGVRNTHLLKFFTKCDPRFVPLVLTLKRWARHHKINDASQGTLSSYALTLMMLHYLQVGVKPPVLPNLIAENPEVFHPRRMLQSLSFHDPIKGEFVSSNKSTVGELFVGFLSYFSKTFAYDYNGISIRESRAVAKRTDKEFSKWIFIEEPYNLDNVARAVRRHLERYIKRVIDASHDIIKESKDLESILAFKLDENDDGKRYSTSTGASTGASSSSASATTSPAAGGPPKKLMESAAVDKEFDDSNEGASTSGKASSGNSLAAETARSGGGESPGNLDPGAVLTEVSELYQLAAKRSLQVSFDVVGESGPPHKRIYSTRCSVVKKKGGTETLLASTGQGNNKRTSKLAAAKAMLAILDEKKLDVSKKESFP